MNIGIVVPHLGLSQISFYAIKEVNRLVDEKHSDDITLFFEHLVPSLIPPKCAVMCVNEIMSFKGTIITTTLDTTLMTLSRNTRKDNRVVFYVWDLEWMRPQKNNYLSNYQIFNSVHKLVARSDNHAKAIENYTNRNVDAIVKEFNVQEIIRAEISL
jgi:hypothetical protein